MDSTHLTAVRTGLAGALAADVLARRDADTVAVVGAGRPGRAPAALARDAPARSAASSVFDTVAERAAAFATRMAPALGVPIAASGSVDAAVRDAGVVLVATWARAPFLLPGMLAPGRT